MFKRIGNTIASRISPTRMHWTGLKQDALTRLRHFRHERDAGFQTMLEEDFSLLLQAWGISDEEKIPGIILDLHLRCLLFAAPVIAVLFHALALPDLFSLLLLALIAPPCLLGLLVTRWRMSILRNRAFRPFHRWLTSCFVKKNQRSE